MEDGRRKEVDEARCKELLRSRRRRAELQVAEGRREQGLRDAAAGAGGRACAGRGDPPLLELEAAEGELPADEANVKWGGGE